jgi:hypothetical protein
MKKSLLTWGSLTVAAFGIFLFVRLFSAQARIREGRAFENFPIGKTVPVSFRFDSALERFTDLEKRDQRRDWVLYSVMSDSGLDPATLRKSLYDVPPLRAHYLEAVARFDYGESRSRVIGNGEILAIMPKYAAARQKDDLADIVDREYKNSGQKPNKIHIFEYELDEGAELARVTHTRTAPGAEFFTDAYGYIESAVPDRPAFDAFMRSIDELISARLDGDTLYLAGRKRAGSSYRGLKEEDTAALWQSEQVVQGAAARVKEFNAKWSTATYRTAWEKTLLESQRASELKQLKESLGGGGRNGFVEHSGFSLDPTFDYQKLMRIFELLAPAIARTQFADRAEPVRTALASNEEGPWLQLLFDLENSSDQMEQKLGHFGEQLLEVGKFQHARYDGPLDGTEPGMVLFYTDLLAKLWALDYLESAPSRQVEDFQPLLKIDYSPIYRLEMEKLSNTRLWFGPRDEGFQKTDTGILFASTATRVYAASSSTLKPGQEAEPNAASAQFLGWWDRHYEEVARYEPEYQRLNEIMKWSLLLSWLGERNAMDKLAFLSADNIRVSHSAWFPDWARANKNLRFNFWDKINFYPRGYKGVATESLPMLSSRRVQLSSGVSGLIGGVSLGSKNLLLERPILSKEIDPLLRRSNLNYGDFKYGAERGAAERFTTFDKTSYEFQKGLEEGRFIIKASAKSGAKLRDVHSELHNSVFEYRYRGEPGGLAVEVKSGDVPVGEFVVSRREGGFVAAFRSLDLERANNLARVVERTAESGGDVASALARRPGVISAVKSGDNYLVRTQGSPPRWLKISREGAPEADIAAGAQMRYASMGGGGDSRLNIAWVSDEQVSAEMTKSDFVVLQRSGKDLPQGVSLEIGNRGPPPAAGPGTPVDLNYDGIKVQARQFGKDGPIYVDRKSLPSGISRDARLLSRPSFPSDGWHAEESFTAAERGDYRQAARELANAPDDFRSKYGAYRQRAEDNIDDMLRNGRQREARSRIDEMLAAFGEDSGLVQRRNAIARADDLARAVEKSPEIKAQTAMFAEKGEFKIELRLLEYRKSAASWAEAKAARKGVYVASDHLQLEPSSTIMPSLDQVLSPDNVVSKLTNWEIATAQPDVIRDMATQRVYRLHPETSTHAVTRNAGMGLNISARYTPLSQRGCDQSAGTRNADCQQDIYLVEARQARISSLSRP